MSVTVEVLAVGKGTCTLSGKECEGYMVSFGEYREVFLSEQSFKRMMKMHLPARSSPAPKQPAPTNGQPRAEAAS